MALETFPFDAAEYLTTEVMRAEFLNAAFESGDARHIAHAIGIVARARGMSSVAADTGLHRQALYRALDEKGNPTIDTFFKALNALGIRLQVAPGAPTG